MLRDHELLRLSPLARRFRTLFLEQLGHVPHLEALRDRYQLVVPPAHPEVGELRVQDDDTELTISLGEHHHWHIALYTFSEDSPERQNEHAALAAITSIRNLLEHRTVLRITRKHGKVVSSTTYSIAHADMSPPSTTDSEYVWAGPRVRLL